MTQMAIEVPNYVRGIQSGTQTIYQVYVPGHGQVPIYYSEDDIADVDLGKKVALMDDFVSEDLKRKGTSSVKRSVYRTTYGPGKAVGTGIVVIVVAICVVVIAGIVTIAITQYYNGNIRLVTTKKATQEKCLQTDPSTGDCCKWLITAADGSTVTVDCCGASEPDECVTTKIGGSVIGIDYNQLLLWGGALLVLGGGGYILYEAMTSKKPIQGGT